MKKIITNTFFMLAELLVFVLGIILNSTWLFLIGLFALIISVSVEFKLFEKEEKKDDGDSDDDNGESYEVNEASIKDNVLYLHKN